jgi:hypothetical protein
MVEDIGVTVQRFRNDANTLNHQGKGDTSEICPYLWGSVFLTWDAKVCFCEYDYIGSDLLLADFQSVKNHGADYWNNERIRHARMLFRPRRGRMSGIGVRCECCKFYPLPNASTPAERSATAKEPA